ncbi:MAG: putative lipid II flippase FtsW [Bacilli bacterium]|nr:putative lipid II flippase FtsW [Bacilli bacterium]
MKIDKTLLFSVIILMIISLFMIYSASYVWAEYKFNNPFKYVINQGIFSLIGIIILFIISKIDYKLYYKHANKLLIVCIVLLILVLIPGLGIVRNGSRSWFGIGSFSIQPSEFSKIGLIIFTSKYLAKSNKFLQNYKKGIFPILFILLLIFGLIMLEPDFGTGMIIVLTIIACLFVAGVPMNFFIILFFLGIAGITLLIAIAPYRMDRITSFLNPWSDPLGTGFQIIQSLYAIGPNGLFGVGYLNSRQKAFYLPEPQTDFIFSIIAEEFGIVGTLVILTLFAIILIRGIKISLRQENLFAKYLAFGLIFQLIVQVIMNLSVVIGLIPVTGVTLPFMSYGGSSLLTSLFGIGILLNISRQSPN